MSTHKSKTLLETILSLPKFVWVILVLVIAYQIILPSGSYHVRMTVNVETPEGIKTGSAVWKISHRTNFALFPGTSSGLTHSIVAGNAVVVDLGERGILFALMRPDDRRVNWPYSWDAFLKKADSMTLTDEQYPKFVHFKDLKDPTTVQNLIQKEFRSNNSSPPYDFVGSVDHAEEIFGKGVKIKEVQVERTWSFSTQGIDKLLPWLPKISPHFINDHAYHKFLSCREEGDQFLGVHLYQQLKTSDFQKPPTIKAGDKVDTSFCEALLQRQAQEDRTRIENTLKKWRLSAEQGNVSDQYALGMAYLQGNEYAQAHFWLTLVAGPEGGIGNTARQTRRQLIKKMTPEQLAEAEKLLEEWKKTHAVLTEAPANYLLQSRNLHHEAWQPENFGEENKQSEPE